MMKILLLVLVSSAVFEESAATGHDELSKAVVGALREMIDVLKGGATANDLRHHLDGIVVIIDGILADANASVEKVKVHTFLDSVKSKIDVDKLDGLPSKSFAILRELADLLEKKQDAADLTEEFYETLETIRVVVVELLENMDVLGDGIIYTFQSKIAPVSGQGIYSTRHVRAQRPLNRTRRCWIWCTTVNVYGR